MAARKSIRRKAGDAANTKNVTEEQVHLTDILVAVKQLQETTNKLLAASAARDVVWYGGLVTKDTGALTCDVTAGELRLADGTHKAFAAASNVTLTTAHATLDRTDLIQIATATGTITKKDGATAAAGTSVAPAPDTGNIALASTLVAATATEPATPVDLRPRQAVISGSAAVADTALFVTADQ